MKLRFLAREDQLVFVPHINVSPGAPERYVGRRFDAALRGYPATEQPHEFDSESTQGQRLIRLVTRDGCLWPADEATAKACGMKAQPKVKFAHGVWAAEGETIKEVAPVVIEESVEPARKGTR
jgi:hypothetical protein